MLWTSLAKPKSAIFMTLLSVTRTFLAARSLCIHWDGESETAGGRRRGHGMEKEKKKKKEKQKLLCWMEWQTFIAVYGKFGELLMCVCVI